MTAPVLLALILAMVAIVINSDYRWKIENDSSRGIK